MEKINAPFTDEQVEKLNEFQNEGKMHPFTCCSPSNINKCMRRKRVNEGLLIATNEGWVCPCGKIKQSWAWAFMAE